MAIKLVAVKDVVVFAMVVTPEAKVLEVDDSHLTTLPVCPLKVKVVEFVPVQTAALPAMVPPTETGLTVTVPVALLAVAQLPD